jgi:hypothetical protein
LILTRYTHILLLHQALGGRQTEYHKIKKAYNLLCFIITDCNWNLETLTDARLSTSNKTSELLDLDVLLHHHLLLQVPGPNTVIGDELVFVHLSKLMAYNKDTNGWMHLGHVSGADVYNRPFSRFGFACESVHNNLYIIGGKWESWQNRSRFCVQTLNTVEVCDLQISKSTSRLLGWRACASMVDGGGIITASAVLWL